MDKWCRLIFMVRVAFCHSTIATLSKHWTNTEILTSPSLTMLGEVKRADGCGKRLQGEEDVRQLQQVSRRPVWSECMEASSAVFKPEWRSLPPSTYLICVTLRNVHGKSEMDIAISQSVAPVTSIWLQFLDGSRRLLGDVGGITLPTAAEARLPTRKTMNF